MNNGDESCYLDRTQLHLAGTMRINNEFFNELRRVADGSSDLLRFVRWILSGVGGASGY